MIVGSACLTKTFAVPDDDLSPGRRWLAYHRHVPQNAAHSADDTPSAAAGQPSNPQGFADMPVAGLPKRIIALMIDWSAASVISYGFFDYHAMATLAIFAGLTVISLATLSATPGHLLLGLAVRRPGRRPAGPVAAIVRTVLLCLVIPAIVWSRDGRGLHDAAAGTTITEIR